MIRVYHHYVSAEGQEARAIEALGKWLGRMQNMPGFVGAQLLREYRHHGGEHLAITLDWDSHASYLSFWNENKQYNPAPHHDHAHDHNSEDWLVEKFHGDYEVIGDYS